MSDQIPPKAKPKIQYSPKILAAIRQAADAGATDNEIIKAIGCNRRTFYRWKEKYPEITDALTESAKRRVDADAIAKLEQRKKWCNDWIDTYLRTQGETEEVCDGDGLGSYTKRKKGKPPDWRLIDRILGTSNESEKFEVTITLAMPESDEDDEDFDEDDDEDDE